MKILSKPGFSEAWKWLRGYMFLVLSSALLVHAEENVTEAVLEVAGRPGEHNMTEAVLEVGGRPGEKGTVQSEGFPASCCTPQTVTIRLLPGIPGYIHLSFDDLDLPPGASLKIYTSEGREKGDLFQKQPDYKFGSWQRPFVTSTEENKLIVLVLRPPQSDFDQTLYVGYRASFLFSSNPEPYYDIVTNTHLCPVIASVAEGSQIRINPQPTSRYRDKWLDCIWQIKNPTTTHPHLRNISSSQTYIRFTDLHIPPEGKLEIRGGPSSQSSEVAQVKHGDLQQPEAGFLSPRGFYIRALIPADDQKNTLSFIYGIIHNVSSELCGSGFWCAAPYESWCLPRHHVCNGVNNCPGGEDENNCANRPATPKPTQTADISDSVTEAGCKPSYYTQCPDGRCVMVQWFCEDNIGAGGCADLDKPCPDGSCVNWVETCPGECESWEKKCHDGRCIQALAYCPEEYCRVDGAERCGGDSDLCYLPSQACDSMNHCPDTSDESFITCYPGLFGVLICTPIVIILCCVCCYKCFCKKEQKPTTTLGLLKGDDGHLNLGFLIAAPVIIIICCAFGCRVCWRRSKKTAAAHAERRNNLDNPIPLPQRTTTPMPTPTYNVNITVPVINVVPNPEATTDTAPVTAPDEPPPPAYDQISEHQLPSYDALMQRELERETEETPDAPPCHRLSSSSLEQYGPLLPKPDTRPNSAGQSDS